MKLACIQSGLIALATIAAFIIVSVRSTGPARAKESSNSPSIIEGRVVLVGNRVAGASVILYAAGEGAPTEVARSKTDAGGRFRLDATSAPKGSVLYVVAKGPNQAVALMTLLGTFFPNTITVNELTTMASTFTAARFINGEAICGNQLALRIAAGNTPNLVDPETGGWGKVLVDPGNSTWDHSASEPEHARLAHQRICQGCQRRLAQPLPPGGNSDWRSIAKEHSRSHGRYCSYAMGQPEGALCAVR